MKRTEWETYTIKKDTLIVETLDALLYILQQDSKITSYFPKGFVLAEDLMNSQGGKLFPKETK